MLNRYPLWKYALIAIVLFFGIFYALPNLYGDEPAVQVRSTRSLVIDEAATANVKAALEQSGVTPSAINVIEDGLDIRMSNQDEQFKARKIIGDALDHKATVALSLMPATPAWLQSIGAKPMYLGLDLRGGVHFLMEVDMEAAQEQLLLSYRDDARDQLREKRIRYSGSKVENGVLELRFKTAEAIEEAQNTLFTVIGVNWAASNSGDTHILRGTLSEQRVVELANSVVEKNIVALRNRIDELGVAEPVVQRQGADRIVVQLPGVQDPARAKQVLGRTATLKVMMVDEDNNASIAAQSGNVPVGSEIFTFRDGRPILLKDRVIYSGENIIDARANIDQETGGPIVSIGLDGQGASINQKVTGDNIGKRMAVVYNEQRRIPVLDENGRPVVDDLGTAVTQRDDINEVITAPVIQSQLGARFQITGLDSVKEAEDIALLLRAGSLSAPVNIIEERTIGPSLGKANIEQGLKSSMIGLLLVVIFMLLYYGIFGVFADVAVVMNLVLIVAVLSLMQATLTLPGVAGMVLTIGMSVDANVLINERIREEVKQGAPPQRAIDSGYTKAWGTILDSNLTTLLAAVMLFYFGTGPVKGFAVTLCIGILTSMFTAIVVTRGMVNARFGGKRLKELKVTTAIGDIFGNLNFIDFMKWRQIALGLSLGLVLLSIGALVTRGLNLGLDFTGGTLVEAKFEQSIEIDELRDYFKTTQFSDSEIQQIGSDSVLVKMRNIGEEDVNPSDDLIAELRNYSGEEFTRQSTEGALCGATLCSVQLSSVSFVGPRFGQELFDRGGIAFLIVLGVILLYVSLRFQWRYSIGASVALLHDLSLVMGFFALAGLEFDVNVLAAVLAVLGYSINDTIVVFDRIREMFRRATDNSAVEVMNIAINNTLTRTILTGVTTLLVLVVLYLFGGETLRGFSIALIVGVIVGTYSSIFIASPVALMLGAKREDLMQIPKEGDDLDYVDGLP